VEEFEDIPKASFQEGLKGFEGEGEGEDE